MISNHAAFVVLAIKANKYAQIEVYKLRQETVLSILEHYSLVAVDEDLVIKDLV